MEPRNLKYWASFSTFLRLIIAFTLCQLTVLTYGSLRNPFTGSSMYQNFDKSDHDARIITITNETFVPFNGDPKPFPIIQRRPYPSDPDCKDFKKSLYEEGTFNKTALASYPGSGNTWTRHLLELASGIYTGSVYMDIELISHGFLGEKENWDSGTTIVQKTHHNFNPRSIFDFDKGILLIRDPYQAIVSFVKFKESGHHTGLGSDYIFRKKEWPAYGLGQTYKWITLAKSWLESGIPLLVIHYEDLRRNPKGQVKKMCQFLGQPCSNLETPCFQKKEEGHFHRPLKRKIIPVPLPGWMRERMDKGINYLNDLLRSLGHGSLPLKYYLNYNSSLVVENHT